MCGALKSILWLIQVLGKPQISYKLIPIYNKWRSNNKENRTVKPINKVYISCIKNVRCWCYLIQHDKLVYGQSLVSKQGSSWAIVLRDCKQKIALNRTTITVQEVQLWNSVINVNNHEDPIQ